MASYKIFTISSGKVSEGATVTQFTLKGAGATIPVITVGETGRGRHREILAVHLPKDLYSIWKEKGEVKVFAGKIGKTKSGKWKLFVESESDSDKKFIAVMPTTIGYRGGNSHTGDRTGETRKDPWSNHEYPVFAEFPGEILIEGEIAQGAAGRMGRGKQLVAAIPKGVWFRTGYSGRLYGKPTAHYYKWDGATLIAMTWDERQLAQASEEAEDEGEMEWL